MRSRRPGAPPYGGVHVHVGPADLLEQARSPGEAAGEITFQGAPVTEVTNPSTGYRPGEDDAALTGVLTAPSARARVS
ncbi:Uncharacterised protein [Mycobacterium tuberculosis]|nr:Uncharacterised protein [Mycobacterium tuberculosis]